jgi:hypothetical protein
MTQAHTGLIWSLLAAAAAALTYLTFRGYLTPELMLHFANAFYC